jgi:hypothetical protein
MATQPLKIGLDFDNTIVCYDSAIAVLAEQMFTLPPEVPRTKLGLRDHLRGSGREPEWTAFQGALYGPGMAYAQPFQGAIETMQALLEEGHQLMIVSHRSRRPYAGPPHDLHVAASEWISQRLQSAGLFLKDGHDPTGSTTVNFLETRDAKVTRIGELGCEVFVDDLQEVLDDPTFPENTVGVLFAPCCQATHLRVDYCISTWQELPGLIAKLP